MSPYSSTNPHAFASLIARQSIADDARNTLGSWDSCMSKAYCKWPVVAVIIIVSLIVLSILVCFARFLCCGLECCFWCCTCCNKCCPSPRNKGKTKYIEAPQYPQQQYGYTPPMNYGGPNYGGASQYASYDVSKNGKVNQDALPAMPSWKDGQTRHVEDTSYNGAEEVSEKDYGRAGHEGIAMGAVTPGSARTKDDDPVYQEDDQSQPMLQQDRQQAQPVSPYQPDDNYAQTYDYNAMKTNPYAASSVGGSIRTQRPAHDYNQYNQQQGLSAYGGGEPPSPTSVYSNSYQSSYPSRAPTYRSQAPTQHQTISPMMPTQGFKAPPLNTRTPQAQGTMSPTNYMSPQDNYSQQIPRQQAISPQSDYTNNTYTNFSRSQSTRYEPSEPPSASAELPGSLTVGGSGQTQQAQPPQRFYGQAPQQQHQQAYEMGGGQGVSRKPVG